MHVCVVMQKKNMHVYLFNRDVKYRFRDAVML